MEHDQARTRWFRQSAHLGAGTNTASAKSKDKWAITSADRLLGSASRGAEQANKDSSAVVLLGLLTRSLSHENIHLNADNGAPLMWVLQDMTGTVPLNFQKALVIGEDFTNVGNSGGSWIPENAMILARGNFGQDDVFHVDSVALPLPPHGSFVCSFLIGGAAQSPFWHRRWVCDFVRMHPCCST